MWFTTVDALQDGPWKLANDGQEFDGSWLQIFLAADVKQHFVEHLGFIQSPATTLEAEANVYKLFKSGFQQHPTQTERQGGQTEITKCEVKYCSIGCIKLFDKLL